MLQGFRSSDSGVACGGQTLLSIKDEVKFLNKPFEKAAASGATFRAAGCTVIYGARALFIFPSPLDEGRVLLRPPKPQRHLGGGQSGGAGFLFGFCPAPLKFMEICKFNGFP